jgi:hypothetical protein
MCIVPKLCSGMTHCNTLSTNAVLGRGLSVSELITEKP